MAAGFKTATVASGDVPATLTSFPSYVDLSRLGITTLAEAQSVRVYADSGKTTEWAREIVSATEMHVKIPSLTSTTSVYVDWDGVRADYAVTDTYGRNAVWSDYAVVTHPGGGTDSTGNGRAGTGYGGVTSGGVLGQIGSATSYDGTNDYYQIASAAFVTVAHYISMWVKPAVVGEMAVFGEMVESTANTKNFVQITPVSPNVKVSYDQWTPSGGNALSVAFAPNVSWKYVSANQTATNARQLFMDGALQASATEVYTGGAPDSVRIGYRTSGATQRYNGSVDELRVRNSAVTANWITTEYNNQSDEAGFWGIWSDVGGGGANTTNFFLMM